MLLTAFADKQPSFLTPGMLIFSAQLDTSFTPYFLAVFTTN